LNAREATIVKIKLLHEAIEGIENDFFGDGEAICLVKNGKCLGIDLRIRATAIKGGKIDTPKKILPDIYQTKSPRKDLGH
jgi:hypothetical protein